MAFLLTSVCGLGFSHKGQCTPLRPDSEVNGEPSVAAPSADGSSANKKEKHDGLGGGWPSAVRVPKSTRIFAQERRLVNSSYAQGHTILLDPTSHDDDSLDTDDACTISSSGMMFHKISKTLQMPYTASDTLSATPPSSHYMPCLDVLVVVPFISPLFCDRLRLSLGVAGQPYRD